MRRHQRLRHRDDFRAVYRRGKTYADGPLLLRVRFDTDLDGPRFGFAVSKSLGGAVVRNRLKRQLRHAARISQATGRADLVVTARKSARGASYHELETVLHTLLGRAGLTDEGNPS
jgi:ribonuclease P protein component